MNLTHTGQPTTRPLSQVQPGRDVKLVAIEGGRHVQARLAALGLLPGTTFTVLRNATHGPFIIAVKQSRVMLGRGLAQRIMVSD